MTEGLVKLILTTHTKGERGGISEIYLDHAKKDLKRAGVRMTQVVGLFFFVSPANKHHVMSQFMLPI